MAAFFIHYFPVAFYKKREREITCKTGKSLFLTWSMPSFAHIFVTKNFKKIRDQIKHTVL